MSSTKFWRDRGFWLQLVIQCAAFVLFGVTDASNGFIDGQSTGGWILVAGYVLVFIGLMTQRWRPETGLVIVAVGLLAATVSMAGVYILAYLVVCYESWFISAFIRRRRKMWLTLLLTGSVGSVIVFMLTDVYGPEPVDGVEAPGLSEFLFAIVMISMVAVLSIGLFWQLGMTTRRQQERMETLATRVELAASAERTRIAREMHDIVAHSLTAVIAQADGGRYAGRKDPQKAIEALDTISSTGRDALTQMRQLLSVLRDDSGANSRGTDAPPGLAGVPALVEDAERAGLVVDYKVLGNPVEVDVAVGLSVFRTVQESLTNILKHAGPTKCRVQLDWNVPGKLRITVDNAPGDGLVGDQLSSDGRGQGLVGLRERAGIHGGTADWGASEIYVGGWCVEVTVEV
ncbi:MAG TPA: histidine kinase [Candidatus Corynebacterium avicola]|uniref:histidine kinase n=1 Tax=Candidatus Corynebacterium avicola TaxID=2838527 RepID=A0A9D1RS63_9CORY|nr:histidine kinase [Candidatus Corynebacterium avicola]